MILKISTQLAKVTTIALLFFVLAILLTSKFENPWGIHSFVVLTGSMEPAISKGSIIFTQKKTEYQKGDIVAFRKNGVTVTHRIVDVENIHKSTLFVTQGDANNVNDPGYISAPNILGKNVAMLPFIGNILLFTRSLPGFILLVVLPAVLYIAFEIFSIKSELSKMALSKIKI